MAYRHIFQLRRGWKWASDPKTGKPRDDWAQYTIEQPEAAIPRPGELVLEYDNGIPRLKIGDGTHTFAELEYISVDSFILPKPISITLYADKWRQVVDINGADIVDTYSQVVTVNNAVVTLHSKVDLQPNADQLCTLYDCGVALTTENDGGVITVYAVGGMPARSLSIQATVTEIVLESEASINE